MWSTPGQFLETGQMRINIRAGNLREMDEVRDILESRYGAREVRAIERMSFLTFIVREDDFEDIVADSRLLEITRYIEEDVIRYIPEFPEFLMHYLVPGEYGDRLRGFEGESPRMVPNDPSYGNQWGPECIDAEAAWDVVPDNPAIILAIIDTGVDISHADLRDNYDTNIDRDFVNNDYNADDDMGHGTHCAGISAAVTNNNTGVAGLAPVTIMGVKVMNFLGIGFDSDIVAGIDYAADNGADVINLSLGSTGYTQGLKDACDNAFYNDDVVVIAAAGNENTDRNFYPAAFASVIGVSALATCTTRASFSNYGYDNVELAAPGQHIYSTLPDHLTFWNLFGIFPYDYGYMDGTSMASPHVAGVAAGYLAYASWLSARQVRNVLSNHADDIGDPYYFGNGRVDYHPFQDDGIMGGFGQAPTDEAVSRPETERPLVEAVLDVMKYGKVTVEVIDDSGEVIASYVRHLDHPDADVPVELTNPEEYSYRLRAGEKESPLIRF
jgi:thermitase